LPIKVMREYYTRSKENTSPETVKNIRKIAKYCIVDSLSCQSLMVKRNVINDYREVASIAYVSLFDSHYYAGGMKENLVKYIETIKREELDIKKPKCIEILISPDIESSICSNLTKRIDSVRKIAIKYNPFFFPLTPSENFNRIRREILYSESTPLNTEIKKKSSKSRSKSTEKISSEDLVTLHEKEARRDEKNKANMTRLLGTT
ncbi:4597_t:CDS:2, partial [Gigaspora rosea]